MYHTPGETNDAISIWLPEQGVLLPGDNIYESFPNIYTIRGSPARNAYQWYSSLDFIISLNSKYMIPSHTSPLVGEDYVRETLKTYRDAIQFVHDQTVRQMNNVLGIDEIVPLVKLPAHLQDHRFLQEFYGTVEWSVRGIYDSYIGWFDGDPVNLYPISKNERAKRLADLMSRKDNDNLDGFELMLRYANESIKKSEEHFRTDKLPLNQELQWAFELISHAKLTCNNCMKAKTAYIDILLRIAGIMKNANARNYYLTCANELKRGITIQVTKTDFKRMVDSMPIEAFMSAIPYKVKYEKLNCDENIKVVFTFIDIKESFVYELRNCIIIYTANQKVLPNNYDAHFKTTTTTWNAILKDETSSVSAYASGDVKIDGALWAFKKFMSSLDF